MIISFLLEAFAGLIGFLIALLPTGSLPPLIATGFAYVFHLTTLLNFLLPIDTAFTIIGYVVVFYLAIAGFAFAMWIYSLVRGK